MLKAQWLLSSRRGKSVSFRNHRWAHITVDESPPAPSRSKLKWEGGAFAVHALPSCPGGPAGHCSELSRVMGTGSTAETQPFLPRRWPPGAPEQRASNHTFRRSLVPSNPLESLVYEANGRRRGLLHAYYKPRQTTARPRRPTENSLIKKEMLLGSKARRNQPPAFQEPKRMSLNLYFFFLMQL